MRSKFQAPERESMGGGLFNIELSVKSKPISAVYRPFEEHYKNSSFARNADWIMALFG